MMYQWCGAFRWWYLNHNYIRVGGIKGWMHGGRGSQFWDFRCRAYRTELIPSRVLWCVPTLGQQGILYLITTKMCLVYWLILTGIFLQSKHCFYWIWLFQWPSSQWAQLKGLEHLAPRTTILYWSQWGLEEEGSGSSWSLTPSYSEVVTYIQTCLLQIYIFKIPGISIYPHFWKFWRYEFPDIMKLYMFIGRYACIYVHMNVYVCIYVGRHTWSVHVYIHLCMCASIYECMYAQVCINVCMYACSQMCLHVWMCMYLCMYM